MSILNSSIVPVSGATSYAIDNSLRFNDNDTAYLSRTPSTAGNRKTWTYSAWFKRGSLGLGGVLFGSYTNIDNRMYLFYNTLADELGVFDKTGAVIVINTGTSASFRDTSAWYHVLLSVDSTQATSTDRVKLYINGTLQTMAYYTAPSLNADGQINSTTSHSIGVQNAANYLDGYLAEVNFVDGQALTPSDFGETDATYGHWKPIAYAGTYGTNGFYLPFNDDIGADMSGSHDVFGDGSGKVLYKFQDNVDDDSTNYNGTAYNITYTEGRYGKAAVFDGTNSYIDTGTAHFGCLNTQNYTISLWVQTDEWVVTTGGYTEHILLSSDTTDSNFQQLSYSSYYGGLVYRDRAAGMGSNDLQINSNPKAGDWHHVVVTRSGSTFKMYLDGTLGDTSTGTIGTGSDGNILIGDSSRTSDAYRLHGKLDQVRIFNRALSAEEVGILNSGAGIDESGAGNNWTPQNLSHSDVMLDSPTNNFCTLNPLSKDSGFSTSEGNLKGTTGSTWDRSIGSTLGFSSGKFYFESTILHASANMNLGVVDTTWNFNGDVNTSSSDFWEVVWADGNKRSQAGSSSYGSAFTQNDIIMCAVDMDSSKIWFGKNGTWFASGVPSTGTNAAYTNLTGTVTPFLDWTNGTSSNSSIANFGQDSSFAGNKTSQGNADGNGIGDFYYTPPTGFLALCTQNLPEPTVIPSEHFNTVLYTGDGTDDRAITGLGFAPDLIWLKSRNEAHWHVLTDSVRGDGRSLYSNATNAENLDNLITSLDADGFTVDINVAVNKSSFPYVAWNWKANGAGVSNTDGTITSTVSANVDAGFSIVSYTGTGAVATVGHGLTIAPEMVIVKSRSLSGKNWPTYHIATGNTNRTKLNATDASGASSAWNNTTPSASLITLGSQSEVNTASATQIAYAFHSVEGYSKVGSYTGNGSADGTFVHCGFRPAYVMIKRSDGGTSGWYIIDNARDTYNPADNRLEAHSSGIEYDGLDIHDFVSNGFKLRDSDTAWNTSGGTYIFIAFAETDFKHSNAR
jgi:hypothetical protein